MAKKDEMQAHDTQPEALPDVVPVRWKELDGDQPGIRARGAGSALANLGVHDIMTRVGRTRKLGDFFKWGEFHENKVDGTYYLTPTDENNPERVRLNWSNAGKQITFTLRGLLKAKGISIPRDHSLFIPCDEAKLADGLALHLLFGDRRLEPMAHRDETTPPPAPTGQAQT